MYMYRSIYVYICIEPISIHINRKHKGSQYIKGSGILELLELASAGKVRRSSQLRCSLEPRPTSLVLVLS